MIELARRRMMMGGSTKPYDAEVEYLESAGYSAINTEYIGTGYDTFEVKVAVTNINVPRGSYPFWFDVFGATPNMQNHKNYLALIKYTGQASYPSYYYNTYELAQYSSLSPTTFNDNTVRNYHVFKGTANEVYVDGVRNTPSAVQHPSPNLTIPYFLFNNNIDGELRYPSYLRIPYFKLWSRGGELVRDMIPVRKGGVGYMYDRVTKRLYGALEHTARFIIGPDK